ncbi:MAG: DUF1559 domain-containing protein, partial [Planctomycetaceae bacterium]|nr:DUF1559 domain-containing protein [Planctomycetaceae bacterium]
NHGQEHLVGGHTHHFGWAVGANADIKEGINGTNTAVGGTYRWVGEIDGAGFSSHHPGGCHFLYVDGSVHFLSEMVHPDVLCGMAPRAGGEVVPSF